MARRSAEIVNPHFLCLRFCTGGAFIKEDDVCLNAGLVENARRQALAAANDLMRVYSMLDVKLNRSLLDNIMLLGLHHAVEPLEVGAEQENWEIP